MDGREKGPILPRSPADLISMLSKPLPMRTIMRRALNFSRSSRVSVMVWYMSAPTASFSTCRGTAQGVLQSLPPAHHGQRPRGHLSSALPWLGPLRAP